MVKTLAAHADVFSLGYGQNRVRSTTSLTRRCWRRMSNRLRALGYSEIVLIGHSAGALDRPLLRRGQSGAAEASPR